MIPSSEDIAWLAGILEGEGCFTLCSKFSPLIRLNMTDLDVVERAADIVNIKKSRIYIQKRKILGCKTSYVLLISGQNAFKWMKLIRPYMCSRRGQKIDDIIKIVFNGKPDIEKIKNPDICSRGHSIKYEHEYYSRPTTSYKQCKRCAGIRVRDINFSGLNDIESKTFINPFTKEMANA